MITIEMAQRSMSAAAAASKWILACIILVVSTTAQSGGGVLVLFLLSCFWPSRLCPLWVLLIFSVSCSFWHSLMSLLCIFD